LNGRITSFQRPQRGGNVDDNVTGDSIGGDPKITSSIENLFPCPGVIIKDIYELFKADKSKRERDFAVLNYLNLLFKNNNQ